MFVFNKTCIICYDPIYLSLNHLKKSCNCKYHTHRSCITRYIESNNRNSCLMCNKSVEVKFYDNGFLNTKQVTYIKLLVVFLYSLIILIEMYRLTHIVSKNSWEFSRNLTQIEEPMCPCE